MRMAMRATLNKEAAADVAAKVWDDYLHLFGTSAYVWARYISALPITEDGVGNAGDERYGRHLLPPPPDGEST